MGFEPHPARFPRALPEFFIKFLTNEGDFVLDFFAGSNTTGEAAEALARRWLAIDSDPDYVVAPAFRFMGDWPDEAIRAFVANARERKDVPLHVCPRQGQLL